MQWRLKMKKTVENTIKDVKFFLKITSSEKTPLFVSIFCLFLFWVIGGFRVVFAVLGGMVLGDLVTNLHLKFVSKKAERLRASEYRVFREMYEKFSERQFLLSYTDTKNIFYLSIVGMGEKVLPLIFEKLKEQPSMCTLDLINGIIGIERYNKEINIPEEVRGKVNELTQIYLIWGKENGYC